eukprot:TRINITY_DN8838_c0_g1_i1.p1 TRINITY_DN8838_c0_g1~~TRINITY_DN8838_c0_g1_i1.p1  ORF type:complete len:205 (-),score=36.70 TRINITY_DN8838_c0_g1_i1:66-680(-)
MSQAVKRKRTQDEKESRKKQKLNLSMEDQAALKELNQKKRELMKQLEELQSQISPKKPEGPTIIQDGAYEYSSPTIAPSGAIKTKIPKKKRKKQSCTIVAPESARDNHNADTPTVELSEYDFHFYCWDTSDGNVNVGISPSWLAPSIDEESKGDHIAEKHGLVKIHAGLYQPLSKRESRLVIRARLMTAGLTEDEGLDPKFGEH